jgi:hypothetical protein
MGGVESISQLKQSGVLFIPPYGRRKYKVIFFNGITISAVKRNGRLNCRQVLQKCIIIRIY